MATLNTLRTKGGVFLAVVIGLSLLAFLLGDLASSGGSLMNSSNMTVGKVNGVSISYQDYLNKIEKMTIVNQILSGSDILSEQENDKIREYAWSIIVRNESFDNSFNKLGLAVSADESFDMADGVYISPMISGIFVNRETGEFDRNMMKSYVSNLDADVSGRSRVFWSYLEEEMVKERQMMKYMSLVNSGFFVTDIEIGQGFEQANNFFSFDYVSKSITTIPDSLIKVTQSDLRSYYDNNKALFKQTASRDVEYVVFDILPSVEDNADAKKFIETLAGEFRAASDVPQFIALNSQDKFNDVYYKESELPEGIREYVASKNDADIYGPVLSGDVYTMAKVVGRRDLPDTIAARQIVLNPDQSVLADSILNVLRANKGADFAEMVATYSIDKSLVGGDLGRFNPSFVGGELGEKLYSTSKGDIFSVNASSAIFIVQVTDRGPLYPKVKVGTLTYNVEPSDQTQQAVYAKASQFANEIKAKNADFDKAVGDNGLFKRVARLSAGDRNVSGIKQSQEIVRWAFNADLKDVSGVMTIGESNIVAKVVGAREHGFASFKQAEKEIIPLVIREKKVESLSKDMSGASSLDELAQKIGSTIKSASDISFNTIYVPDFGIVPAVVGVASVLPEGQLSKPTDSNLDVTVVKVTSRTTKDEVQKESVKALLESSNQAVSQGGAYSAVVDLADIQDTRIKFF